MYTNEKNFLKNEKIDGFLLPRFLKRHRKVVILRDIAQSRRDNRVFPVRHSPTGYGISRDTRISQNISEYPMISALKISFDG